MKRITILIITLAVYTAATAQETNRYFNFRPSLLPTTYVFSEQGNLRVEASRQAYLGDPDVYDDSTYNDFSFYDKTSVIFWDSWLIKTGNRVGVAYTLSNNLTVGAAFLISSKNSVFNFAPYEPITESDMITSNISFEAETKTLELSGTYHGTFTTNLAYEARLGLIFGKGEQIYKHTYMIPALNYNGILNLCDDHLNYGIFSNNFAGSIAYRYHKLQLALQINTGYVCYFNIKGEIVSPPVYNQIIPLIEDHKLDFYLDPALMIGLEFKHVGIHVQSGIPWSVREGKTIKQRPTLGFGLSLNLGVFRSVK